MFPSIFDSNKDIFTENMAKASEHALFLDKMHKHIVEAMNSGKMYSFGELCEVWLKDPVGKELVACLYFQLSYKPESIEALLTNSDFVKRKLGELAHKVAKDELEVQSG